MIRILTVQHVPQKAVLDFRRKMKQNTTFQWYFVITEVRQHFTGYDMSGCCSALSFQICRVGECETVLGDFFKGHYLQALSL